ncbi:hypothetical protein [Bifidobacterium sp. SO4]|uniref:hypothetical protein n=1 Tax=Bifidobacterium sp. SO4 TaxID=2809030 RepID=UPI001BDD82F5|nr:hypothetical protein [Bifidobacterium sp. SO4]MBT1171239.1 hypothetical protein [Bifidobacterium sp. SO4]
MPLGIMDATRVRGAQTAVSVTEANDTDPDVGDIDFPPDPDDWGREGRVCQYFNEQDEADICTDTPEYYIRAYCWDPGCDEIHTWYYCLRHFSANIGYLARTLSRNSPSMEIAWDIRAGDIPARFQLLEWGRIGEEGDDPLPDPFRRDTPEDGK